MVVGSTLQEDGDLNNGLAPTLFLARNKNLREGWVPEGVERGGDEAPFLSYLSLFYVAIYLCAWCFTEKTTEVGPLLYGADRQREGRGATGNH